MSSNHRGRRPGTRRSEDARRQSAGVRRSFFANNSSASPAEDVLGLVPLTGGRRAVLPSMHATRLPLLLPVRHCVQNKGLLQKEPPSHFESCIFLISRSIAATPTATTVYQPKHRSCLLRSCCRSLMRPHFLHNDVNYGVNFLNTTTYVSLLLSVDCAWFVSRLYHTFIARTNPETLYIIPSFPEQPPKLLED